LDNLYYETFGRVDGELYDDELSVIEYEDNYSNREYYSNIRLMEKVILFLNK